MCLLSEKGLHMYKYWKRNILAIFTFSLLFYLAYVLAQKSWNGDRFILLMDTMSDAKVRNIASINPQEAFFRNFLLTDDNTATFLDAITVTNTETETTIVMPHFLVLNDGGESILACDQYEVIHINFIALGVSFHGHAPQMTLRAECGINEQNPMQLGPFFIPKEQILQSSVKQELFQSDTATVFMHHNNISWPSRWMLDGIRLVDEGEKEFTVALDNVENAVIINW